MRIMIVYGDDLISKVNQNALVAYKFNIQNEKIIFKSYWGFSYDD
jgi:hypothetical protein